MTKPIEPFPGNVRVTVPAHLLDPRGGEHYVLRVIGDGMLAECVCDGDYVIIRRSAAPQPGEMVVALVGDEATLKRYYPEGPIGATRARQSFVAANPCSCRRGEGSGRVGGVDEEVLVSAKEPPGAGVGWSGL